MVSVGVSVVATATAVTVTIVVVADHQVLKFSLQKPHIYRVSFYLWQGIFHHGDSFISSMTR